MFLVEHVGADRFDLSALLPNARSWLAQTGRQSINQALARMVALPLSQEEIAGWTGASIESVGRALHAMRSLHWIETRRREVRVLGPDALRRGAA